MTYVTCNIIILYSSYKLLIEFIYILLGYGPGPAQLRLTTDCLPACVILILIIIIIISLFIIIFISFILLASCQLHHPHLFIQLTNLMLQTSLHGSFSLR